jgi:Transcriptional regulators containing an AAA-type ATPase domain and a DNA-binding domain
MGRRFHPKVDPLPCDIKSETALLEVDLIKRALAQARYNQMEAAPLLGLSYHQLRALLRKHGMVRSRSSRDVSAEI